jgi:hypothetical protein
LAACSQAAEPPPTGDPIACALDGATEFTGDCRSESRIVAGGTIMTIRHPDGGFRRLEIEGDLVRTADGAETPTVTIERDGPRFSLHRPDGGFRRFEPLAGQGIHSIDGTHAAVVIPRADGITELVVDGDRYRVRLAPPGGSGSTPAP